MKRFQHPELVTIAVLAMAISGASDAQTYTVLYNLGSSSGDPLNPSRIGTFAQGRDGNLYSTSQSGGANGYGAIFQLTPSGKLTVFHSFNVTDGAQPNGGLTLGSDGNLYGTAYAGGLGYGNIFKITTGGTFTVLHNFNGSNEGLGPLVAPIQATDGNFYGTAGNGNNANFGTAYKMTPSGTLKVLHTFDSTERYPLAIIQGTDGNFYGTTRGGSASRYGAVYKMTPQGAVTVLQIFNSTDGSFPDSQIIQANDGNFYGTTDNGGTGAGGIVYKMTPAGVLNDLFSFANNGLGMLPYAGIVQATDGKFYGAADTDPGVCFGLLYQITSTGGYSVLLKFNNIAGTHPGAGPQVGLIQHTNGKLYGDTNGGGSAGGGVLYSLDMGLGPFVSLLPTSGKVGKTVEVLGQGFTGATGVSFNGAPASFKVVSDTYLTATVPSGAETGPVSVAAPGGALASNKTFRVTPQIKTFLPPNGPVGTPVKITGVSLTQTQEVTFGGVPATTFTADSDTQVTATAPAGAKTGKIAITTPGGTAASATSFSVTP